METKKRNQLKENKVDIFAETKYINNAPVQEKEVKTSSWKYQLKERWGSEDDL